MPFKSDKQRRFFNSPTGKAKLGQEKVKEFNEASKELKLPEVAKPKSSRFTDLMKKPI